MDPRQELEELRRLDELERKARAGAENPGFLESAAIGLGNWADSKAAGLRGAVRDYLPGGESIVNAADAFDKWRGVQPPTEETRAQAAPVMAGLREKQPGGMFAGEFAGDLTAKTPLGMAALGFLDPGTLAQRGASAGMGYAGGKVGEAVGAGIAKMMGPRVAETAPKLADEFFTGGGNKWGIPLTVGQATQNRPAQVAESVLANLPGSSGVIGKAHDRTFGAYNRAISKTFGEDASALTPEVMGAAKSRIGGVFNEVTAKNATKFDEPLFNDLLRVSERAKTDLTPDEGAIVRRWIDNIVRDVNPEKMEIAGKTYKAYDSRLGKLAKSSNGTLSDVVGDLRSVMREAMDRSISPEDAAKWAKARKEYMNLQTVARVTQHGRDDLSTAGLLQAVNQSQKNAKFGSGNDLAELAQWAKKTLPDKIPNSGTAQRLFYQKLLSNPLTTVGAVGGIGYGADSLGLGPADAGLGMAGSYALARALAGKPSSKATEELLKRLGGGLLGAGALSYAR